jgi:antitoxin PrlF
MSNNSTTRFDESGEPARPSRSNNNYPVSPAKIGNQDGYRLPRAFSRDHPELVGASGHVEVLDENTLLVRLKPIQKTAEDRDDVMMSLFLDFLMKSAVEEPESLIAYTENMSQEANKLLIGVEIDED